MKSVYTGDEKVAEFESYDELRVGDGKPAFVYEGNELVYPSPVKDGLVLWYDFSGRTNTDGQRGIAEDLSGNGNHGTLQNFNFTPESGYDKNKLLFDGVDDQIDSGNKHDLRNAGEMTVEIVIEFGEEPTDWVWFISNSYNGAHPSGYSLYHHPNFGGLVFGCAGTILRTDIKVNKKDRIHFMGVSVGGESKAYLNGSLISEIEQIGDSVSDYRKLMIGSASYYTSKKMSSDMYSARIYNKALTPEEIAHNYAIEKERFGIE